MTDEERRMNQDRQEQACPSSFTLPPSSSPPTLVFIGAPSVAKLVLKPMDDDCLLDGELHPSIRLRLERVRELPVPAVANLHGVERGADGRPALVWQFVDGRTLQDVANSADARGLAALRAEVMLAVESLHAAGIAHGGIHERNVIVDGRGAVRLTHVSPLLYDDPRADRDDVTAMFERLGLPAGSPSPGSGDDGGDGGGDAEDGSRHGLRDAIRLRAIIAAAVVLLLGVAAAVAIAWYVATD